MKLTPEQKAERARARLLNTVIAKGAKKYSSEILAPMFQEMIRAEAGADSRLYVSAVINGAIRQVMRGAGECVCVTCGKTLAWNSGIKGMHTGHFLGSRCNSILYEEANVAPQCSSCNYYRNGAPQEFRLWMEAVRGADEIERLEKLKPQSRQFTREELVDMRIAFQKRLNAAIITLKGAT